VEGKQVGKIKPVLKWCFWLFVSSIFMADLLRIILDLSYASESVHQHFLTVFFHSSFGLFEMIMGAALIYYMIKSPKRRIRIVSVAFFHYSVVLILPVAFKDSTLMALLYPWPHTLLAFDPGTKTLVTILSLLAGFAVIPFLTLKWGAKGFCGYVCPHGAFYSESYGRLFKPRSGKLPHLRKYFPPAYFLAMTAALLAITFLPSTLIPVRQAQKTAFFLFSEFTYLVIAIPLLGPRSYCTHLCPIGYEVRVLLSIKRSFSTRRNSPQGSG